MMTEDKKTPWLNQEVELQTVVNLAGFGSVGLGLFAAACAALGQISWWFVPFVVVVPLLWTAVLIGTLLWVQVLRVREQHSWMSVKVRLLGWEKTWCWDYRSEGQL
jgi:hypothetical protein